jgi:hypothetical protein
MDIIIVDDDHEEPEYPSPVAVGDTVTIGRVSATNDVGGTLLLDDMKDVEAVVTKAFWDYECGWRYHGKLVNEADVEAVRASGTTEWTPEHYKEKFPGIPDLVESVTKAKAEFDPSKVYFSEHELPKPAPAPGR